MLTMNCMETSIKKVFGNFSLSTPWNFESCDLFRKNTKEEIELFIAEYSLKSACIASSDISNSCASVLLVACGPVGVTTLDMHEWFLLASLELSTPHVSTRGLENTVIYNF